MANKLKVFFVGFAVFGYGVISFLVDDASNSRYVTVPYRLLVLLLSFLAVLSSLNTGNKITNDTQVKLSKKTAKVHHLLLFILSIFILIYSIRLWLDISSFDKLLIKSSNEYLSNWLGICLLPGFGFLFLSARQSRSYLYCSWIFLFVTCLLVLFIDPQSSLAFIQQGRLTNAALDPISLSHYGTSLILTSTFILLSKQRILSLLNLVYLFAIFLGCFSLFVGASRGPVVALLVGIVFLCIGAGRRRAKSIKIPGIMFSFLSIAVVASLMAARLGSFHLYRLEGMFTANFTVAESDSNRLSYLHSALELIWNNIMFGYGLEVPGVGYPHNLVVEAFLSTGILGGLIFTCVYVYSVVKAIYLIRNDWERWGWLGLLFIQYAIAAVISSSLYGASSFWYLLFAVISRSKAKPSADFEQRKAITCE